jgi:hypothetical protein
VADWTPVAVAGVTGLTGVIGGFIGYLAARSQGRVERAKIEAENERLRIQHDLDRATERKVTYHEFMMSSYRFFLAATETQPLDQDGLKHWIAEYDSRATAAKLFGTTRVSDSVETLEIVTGEVVNNADWTEIESSLPEAYAPLHERWWSAYQSVKEAMRADIAPDSKARGDVSK